MEELLDKIEERLSLDIEFDQFTVGEREYMAKLIQQYADNQSKAFATWLMEEGMEEALKKFSKGI